MRRAGVLLPFLLLPTLAAVSCGEAHQSVPPVVPPDAADDDGSSDTLRGAPCQRVGETICDLQLEGYARNETTGLSNEAAYEKLLLSEVLARGKQRYAFVFQSAFW